MPNRWRYHDGHRLGRNRLIHKEGDTINSIFAAADSNTRRILK